MERHFQTGQRLRPPTTAQFFATFAYAWLTIGLFTGTLVLVVAVRGVLDLIQRMGWEQTAQNRILMGVIFAFVVGSFLLARRVVRLLYRQTPRSRRLALGALAVPALMSGYAWSNPARFLARFAGSASTSLALSGGPTFIFGSYPDDNRVRELKKQGVTAIVSLQSPAVLVEIQGINEERKSAEREHVQFIEAPMLPWVSDNTESLEKIKQIALTGKGTYYVHCGLGRDRVNIAKRVIEALGPQTHARLAAAADLKSASSFAARTEPFERGLLMRLADGAWVIPYPNRDEFYGFILQGQPGHVYLVLDPADTTQARWIAEAEKQMTQYAVPFTSLRYPGVKGDTATAKLVAQFRALKPPFTVIVPAMPFTPGSPTTPVARALALAYKVRVEPPPKSAPVIPGETPGLTPTTVVPPAAPRGAP